jgi:hypothetical protein
MISESLQIKKRVKKSMNKIVQTIIIAIFLVALIFLITIVGILLIVVSAVGIVIAVLMEGARNEKKKERFADDFCFEVVHLHPKETSVCV